MWPVVCYRLKTTGSMVQTGNGRRYATEMSSRNLAFENDTSISFFFISKRTCFGVLCGRPRLWLLTSLSLSYAHDTVAAPFDCLLQTPPSAGGDRGDYVAHFLARSSGDAASVWHTILPFYWRKRQRTAVFCRYKNEAVKHGEGSWNVVWDARPARWLHHPDFTWLIFGVSVAALLVDPDPDLNLEVLVECDESKTNNYRVMFHYASKLFSGLDSTRKTTSNQTRNWTGSIVDATS
ncbi:hypothetical protein C2S51_021178 [Perilla frutescens var. frutescens]|nr:hypothetical protein C2S51_021178 [Perilla frutescens var. frutescens]